MNPLELVKHLQKLTLLNTNFGIAKKNPETGNPSNWIPITQTNEPLQNFHFRQQSENEIIIELDKPSFEENKKFWENELRPKLYSFYYEVFFTGGKSLHIQFLFHKSLTDEERIKWLFENTGIFLEDSDKSKELGIDWNYFSKNSRQMIALEYQEHFKHNKEKILIESNEPEKVNDFLLKGFELPVTKEKITERKVEKTISQILKEINPTEQERVSVCMQLFNIGYDSIQRILDFIDVNNKWEDYNPKITGEKLKIALQKYGVKENPLHKEEIEFVANQQFYDFTKIRSEFKDTDNHLPEFNLIEEMLGLSGEDYYATKKFLVYYLNSCCQNPIQINVGQDYIDNRLHGLIIGSAGKGKGVIKNSIKRVFENDPEIVIELSGICHPEQLIGKVIYKGTGVKRKRCEILGYLANPILLHDECQKVINEEDKMASEVMRIKRQGMDIYGNNRITKKLVDVSAEDSLSYCSPSRCLDFIHPEKFHPVFFDTGTFRRYFCFNIGTTKQVKLTDSVNSIFVKRRSFDEFINFYSAKKDEARELLQLNFDEESIKDLAKYTLVWNYFCLNNPNPKIRRFGEMSFYSIKGLFLRCASIKNLSNLVEVSYPEHSRQGYFDALQFLIETISNYEVWGDLNKTSSVWNGAKENEILALEWLFRNGAVSEETSSIKIRKFQEVISEIYGLHERQAIGIFSSLKSRGFIVAKKGQHDSKVWLGFLPNTMIIDNSDLEKYGIEVKNTVEETLINFIRNEKQKLSDENADSKK